MNIILYHFFNEFNEKWFRQPNVCKKKKYVMALNHRPFLKQFKILETIDSLLWNNFRFFLSSLSVLIIYENIHFKFNYSSKRDFERKANDYIVQSNRNFAFQVFFFQYNYIFPYCIYLLFTNLWQLKINKKGIIKLMLNLTPLQKRKNKYLFSNIVQQKHKIPHPDIAREQIHNYSKQYLITASLILYLFKPLGLGRDKCKRHSSFGWIYLHFFNVLTA